MWRPLIISLAPVGNAHENELSAGSIYRESRYDTGRIWRELDMAGAGHGGSQIRREPNLATYRGQTLESQRALEASALLPSHSPPRAQHVLRSWNGK